MSLDSELLRLAIADGVVDTVITPFRPEDWLLHAAASWLEARDRELDVRKIDPSTFELAVHPRSERWQEHSFPPITHPDVTQYWAVEVARLVVPGGDIGILHRIDQVIYDVDGNYYPTSSPYWGTPYSVLEDLSQTAWYLQLDFFDGTMPERFSRVDTIALTRAMLPGRPYPELPTLFGLFYAAQNPAGNTIRAPIQGRHMLRLFFITPPTAEPLHYQWTVSGRLCCTLQTSYSPESAANLRRA